MKHLVTLALLLSSILMMQSQVQLDVQGNPASSDTVATIKVNYPNANAGNIVGLSVQSKLIGMNNNFGTAGYFVGGRHGLIGLSDGGEAVLGEDKTGYGVVGLSTFGIGVRGYSEKDWGVFGHSMGGRGVYGLSTSNIGVYGQSTDSTGVEGISTNDIGVHGISTNGFGILGESASTWGIVGFGIGSDFWALTGTYNGVSSRRWKSNIVNISDPLAKLSKLRGVYFDWDEAHGGKHTIGFIAEEVGGILPEIVVYEENGIDAKGMDYSKMTALLVEASNAMRREYQQKFEAQEHKFEHREARIKILETELMELKSLLKAQVPVRVSPE